MTETLTTEQFKRARAPSPLEQKFADNAGRLPPFEREYRFHPERMWRFDVAWPALKIAVELQGGNFNKGGHNRGARQGKDMEKINAAQLAGWIVLQFGTKQMDNIAEVMEVVLAAVAARQSPAIAAGLGHVAP